MTDELKKQFREALKSEVNPLLIGLRNELKNLHTVLSKIELKEAPAIQKSEIVNLPADKEVQRVIVENQPTELTLTNPQKDVEVIGLSDFIAQVIEALKASSDPIPKSIRELQELIKVQLETALNRTIKVRVENQQGIEFPTVQKVEIINHQKQGDVIKIANRLPDEAIPVVLTDKTLRRFYDALDGGFATLSGGTNLDAIEALLVEIRDKEIEIAVDADSINLNTDDLEELLTSANTKLDTIIADFNAEDFATELTLSSVLSALNDLKTYTDGIEALLTTISTIDYATEATQQSVLSAINDVKTYTDGIEGLLTTIDTSLGTINSTVATLLTEAEFEARTGEVQATPTLYTVLGRLKAIADLLAAPTAESTPNLWQRLTFAEKGFLTATNVTSIAGTTEQDFFLLRNPIGSGKTIRFDMFRVGVSVANTVIRIYRQPTITSVGTALTIFPIKGSTSSGMNAYVTPTISARGTFIETLFCVQGSNSFVLDLSRYLTAGGDLLITVDPATGNADHSFTGTWAEVDPTTGL